MRKQPQQQRSRQMVATLLEATARCIAQHGLDGTTTPRIAELAGVSVGSLYQYFADKEAMLQALLEKLAGDVGVAIKRLPLAQVSQLRDLVRVTIQLGFSLLNGKDGLYLELIRNWHRLPTQHAADLLQKQLIDVARLYFLKHYSEYPIRDLHVRMFIIVNSTIFTMVRFVMQDDPLLGEADVARGLEEMIFGYLELA